MQVIQTALINRKNSVTMQRNYNRHMTLSKPLRVQITLLEP